MAQQIVTIIEAYEIGEVPMVLSAMFDEGLTIECIVTADMVRDDYGVPGSPVWASPTNEAVDSIEVNGTEYSVAKAELVFGKDATDMIWEMALDAANEKGEWE
jgi:hypothetical protein